MTWIGSENPTRRGANRKRLVTYVEIDHCALGAELALVPDLLVQIPECPQHEPHCQRCWDKP